VSSEERTAKMLRPAEKFADLTRSGKEGFLLTFNRKKLILLLFI
jgi:hypothetical protein